MARVVHFEVPADEPEKLATFFEKTFGWSIRKWDGPDDYWLVMTGNEEEPGIDGGINRRSDGNSVVVNTIDVEDLDATIAKIEANGGEITMPKMAVPGVGWMAYFKDPEGNVYGMMESDPGAS